MDLERTGVPGGSLRLGPWTLKNQGSAPTTASGGWFASGYYLSTDPIITPADRELKGLADTDASDLQPGQVMTFPGDHEISIPDDVVPGPYYFGILVDPSNHVSESDKSNNFVSIRIDIVKAMP